MAGERKPVNVKANATDGNWLQYRGDRRLSGHSLIKGDITKKPEVKWKYDISGKEYTITVGLGDSQTLKLPSKNIDVPYSQSQYEQKWTMPEAYYDKDGNGNLTKVTSVDSKYAQHKPVSPQFKIGKFLKDKTGLQMIEWTYGHLSDGAGARLYYREKNQWKLLWYTPFDAIDAVCSEVFVGDFNNDGKLEVAGLIWYELYVLDVETGKIQDKVRFYNEGSTTGRGYGWLGAFDCDNDGTQDIIQLADTEAHLDYYSWDKNKRLYKVWGKVIESNIAHRKTVLEPAARSVANLMGVDKPEVIFSIFNYDYKTGKIGDDTWHICIISPLTGELLHDFKDQHLAGNVDIDNDGIDEIFTTEATAMNLSPRESLRIYKWDEKSKDFKVIWQKNDSTFVTYRFWKYPLNVANSAPPYNKTLLIEPLVQGGSPVFFTSDIIDSKKTINCITAWQISKNNKVQKVGSITGPSLEVIRSRIADSSGKSVLIKCTTSGNESTIETDSLELSVLSSKKLKPARGSATVYKDKKDGDLHIFATAAANKIVALKKSKNGKIQKLWSAAGRGTGKESRNDDNSRSVVLGNIFSNDQMAVLYIAPDPSGFSQLKAVELDGNELWHTTLSGLSWTEPITSRAGAMYWQTGYFTSSDHQDVILQMRVSPAHSDFKTWLISGKDGSVLWKRGEGAVTSVFRKSWPAGGYWYTIFDWDADGNEDMFNTWFGQFFALSGLSGRYVFNYDPAYYFDRWTPYGMGWAGSLLDNGKIQTIYSHPEQGHLMLWERNWVTGWSFMDVLKFDLQFHRKYPGRVGATMPALGDFDGDGKNELAFPAQKGVNCFDMTTGNLQWYYPNISGELVSCDIDYDGIDEILISGGNKITCIKYNPKSQFAEALWDYSFPESIGALALTGYDKGIQIIAVCDDGFIYSLGRK